MVGTCPTPPGAASARTTGLYRPLLLSSSVEPESSTSHSSIRESNRRRAPVHVWRHRAPASAQSSASTAPQPRLHSPAGRPLWRGRLRAAPSALPSAAGERAAPRRQQLLTQMQSIRCVLQALTRRPRPALVCARARRCHPRVKNAAALGQREVAHKDSQLFLVEAIRVEQLLPRSADPQVAVGRMPAAQQRTPRQIRPVHSGCGHRDHQDAECRVR
jgi:hypothetical protein